MTTDKTTSGGTPPANDASDDAPAPSGFRRRKAGDATNPFRRGDARDHAADADTPVAAGDNPWPGGREPRPVLAALSMARDEGHRAGFRVGCDAGRRDMLLEVMEAQHWRGWHECLKDHGLDACGDPLDVDAV